ncbi:MAG: four helix bundle protein [Bacteroidales bacterium]|nr:four helix bundle protein [Bacteroidales bacterium]
MKTHKDLQVWQKSIAFVTEVYQLTKNFPKDEQFGIISQIRRAAVSIPSNIAEGSARKTTNEYVHFLHIALCSSVELETQFIISTNLNYIDEPESTNMINDLQEIIRMITGLIKSLPR